MSVLPHIRLRYLEMKLKLSRRTETGIKIADVSITIVFSKTETRNINRNKILELKHHFRLVNHCI